MASCAHHAKSASGRNGKRERSKVFLPGGKRRSRSFSTQLDAVKFFTFRKLLAVEQLHCEVSARAGFDVFGDVLHAFSKGGAYKGKLPVELDHR